MKILIKDFTNEIEVMYRLVDDAEIRIFSYIKNSGSYYYKYKICELDLIAMLNKK